MAAWKDPIAKFFTSLTSSPSSSVVPSDWVSRIGEFFSNLYSSTTQSLTSAGTSVKSLLDWVVKSSGDFSMNELNNFKTSLGDLEELRHLVMTVYQKTPKFIEFLANSEESKTLKELFGADKLAKTKEALKILGGSQGPFRVEPGVAVRLVNELMKEPKKVSEKMSRFVELIDKVSKTAVDSSGSAGNTGTGPAGNFYTFTKDKLSDFLEERLSSSQSGWEGGFLMEVGAKQQGFDLGSYPSRFASSLFSGLSWLLTK